MEATNRQPRETRSRNRAMGLFALAVLGAVGALVGCSTSDDDGLVASSESSSAADVTTTSERTTTTVRRTTTTVRPTTTTAPRQDLAVLGTGFTQMPPDSIGNGYVTYGVLLENPNSDWVATYVDVLITFRDAAGTVVGSESEFVTLALPGRSAVGGTTQLTGVAAIDVLVNASADNWERHTDPIGSFTFSDVTFVPDRWFSRVVGQVTTNFEGQMDNVRLTALLYRGDGSICGGDDGYLEFIPSATPVGFEISVQETPPDVANVEVYAAP